MFTKTNPLGHDMTLNSLGHDMTSNLSTSIVDSCFMAMFALLDEAISGGKPHAGKGVDSLGVDS